VTDAVTGSPIEGVIVGLSTNARSAVRAVARMATDRLGRFVFTRLPASDSYYLHASAFGYFNGGYGRDRPGEETGRRLVVADGQWFKDANIELSRPGAVSGVITDEAGEPLVGVSVQILPLIMMGGVRQVAAGLIATTDDRGAYRIYGLTPGQYLVSVPSVQSSVPATATPFDIVGVTQERFDAADRNGRAPAIPASLPLTADATLVLSGGVTPPAAADGRARAYPPTFYPNARTVSDATPIRPTLGQELTGIDVQLRPVATARVSGQLIGPAEAVTGLVLRMLPRGSEGLGFGNEVATALVGENGAFTFLNVPTGDYTLLGGRTAMQYHFTPLGSNLDADLPLPPGFSRGASGAGEIPAGMPGVGYSFVGSSGEDTWSARANVAVASADVTNLAVRLQPSVAVRGRVIWENGEPKPLGFAGGFAGGTTPRPPASSPAYAEPADGSASLGMPRGSYTFETGEFEITGLKLGAYRLRIWSVPTIKSISWNGQDYTDRPFDASEGHDFDGVIVTVTDKVATFTGTVRDDRGLPVTTGQVIVFPANRQLWSGYGFRAQRLQSTGVSSGGSYTVTVPAGDYHVVALTDLPEEGWQVEEFLARAAQGSTPVAIDWEQTRSQNLTIRTSGGRP
jgi:hypothetical protein